MPITNLTVENVRCFHLQRDVPLAPLTILVGENSTGKSTFLALVRLAWEIAYGEGVVDFNAEPFQLGAFDQIAHYRGGKAGRAKSFSIGMTQEFDRGGNTLKFHATFEKSGAQPVMKRQQLHAPEGKLVAAADEEPDYSSNDSPRTITIQPLGGGETKFSTKLGGWGRTHSRLLEWSSLAFGFMEDRMPAPLPDPSVTAPFKTLWHTLLNGAQELQGIPYAAAPVRTRPQRTYDPVTDSPTPEGSHIPMVLARTRFRDEQQWHRLKEFLDLYGKLSGMFKSINIKGLGSTESDPFQIRLGISGPATNLIDVGYGVSQVLPLLVSAFLGEGSKVYLYQQPEVHLHPRAQAELATLFGFLVSRTQKQIIVETHSDYIVDRLRMDIRDKTEGGISKDDVLILFFARADHEVKIHPIRIDEEGNLIGAPSSYREFFSKEEQRLLGL